MVLTPLRLGHRSGDYVRGAIANINRAQKSGIVDGDRWSPNAMVIEGNSKVEIDFDISSEGDFGRCASLGLAQLLYHLIHFSGTNRKRLESIIVGEILVGELTKFVSPTTVAEFILNFAFYYSELSEDSTFLPHRITPPRADELAVLTQTLTTIMAIDKSPISSQRS